MKAQAPARSAAQAVDCEPICIDLNGTLVKTDILSEVFLSVLAQGWSIAFKALTWLARG